MCVQCNTEARSCNRCCSGKAMGATKPVCGFVASIQHAMRMRQIITCGLPGPATFSTLSHKRHDFRKTLPNIKCVFRVSLQHLSEIFFILRTDGRDMIEKVYWYSCKVPGIHVKCPLFLSDFNENWISRQMFEKAPNIKFHENPSNGSQVVPCGWTDRHDKAYSRFSQFCERA